MMTRLGPRLKAAASLVRQGARVADIGTDHAYLPAFLIENGLVGSAIACDVGEGPLMNAASTLSRLGYENSVELRRCDGLDGIEPDEVDDIFICGMGGELISRIIDDASWVRDRAKHLILQPMSALDELRIYLAKNRFSVVEERLVKDGGRLYTVMLAVFSGELYDYPDEYPYIGSVTPNMPHGREYLERQMKRLQKHADMLLNTDRDEDRARLLKIIEAVKQRLECVYE